MLDKKKLEIEDQDLKELNMEVEHPDSDSDLRNVKFAPGENEYLNDVNTP